MYKTKNIEFVLLNTFIIFACLISSVIIFFNQSYEGYEFLFTQPILYSIVFLFVYSKILIMDKSRAFFYVLAGISGIRYVLLPLLIVVSGYYGGRSRIEPLSTSFTKAIWLMNYELLVVSLCIYYFEKKNSRVGRENKLGNQILLFNDNNLGYFLFGLFTLLGLFLFPRVMSSVNFIFPSSLYYEYEYSFIENLFLYCIMVLKPLVFILLIKKIYRKYLEKDKSIYVLLAFVLAILNSLIYFGTNRADIVISAIVSFLVLYKLFGKVTVKYFVLGAVVLAFLFSVVTQARNYSSISGDNNSLVDITDTFQVYVGGVYNVAIAIETKLFYPAANDISVLFFDIFRPMIGINFFIKDLPFLYSNIYFNRRIRIDSDLVSQIIPMIGQGHLFFGFVFAPIFSIIIIRLYYYLRLFLSKTVHLEMYYFVSLVIVRLGFFMGHNIMNIINDISMNLVLFSLVFAFNNFVTRSPKKNSSTNIIN